MVAKGKDLLRGWCEKQVQDWKPKDGDLDQDFDLRLTQAFLAGCGDPPRGEGARESRAGG